VLARWRAERWRSRGRGGPDAFGLVFTLPPGHASVREDAAGSTCTAQAEPVGRTGGGKAGRKS